WGGALRSLGRAVGDSSVPEPASVGAIVTAAVTSVRARGGADVGDKTMVDALVPFADVLASELAAGASVAAALSHAAQAASAAAAATADLVPRKGRARPHAERSLGTPDPGAHSFAVIVTAVARSLGASAATGGR